MRDPDDLPLDQSEYTRPIGPEERQPRGSNVGVFAGVAVAVTLLIGAAVWYFLRPAARSAPRAPAVGAADAERTAVPGATARAATEPLPPLDASDALVRELAARLGAHPQLARWLVNDDLARRFVATVINVAEGTSPASHLRFATPAGAFRARRTAGRWYVDPESFGRFDLFADVFDSLDPAAAAELYRTLHPLFDLAYAEIGNPASSFDATLATAIGNLLRVPVPEPPVELVPQGVGFAYADRSLEERTVAEKQLLRLGPENARRVQAKLSALAAALGLPVS